MNAQESYYNAQNLTNENVHYENQNFNNDQMGPHAQEEQAQEEHFQYKNYDYKNNEAFQFDHSFYEQGDYWPHRGKRKLTKNPFAVSATLLIIDAR